METQEKFDLLTEYLEEHHPKILDKWCEENEIGWCQECYSYQPYGAFSTKGVFIDRTNYLHVDPPETKRICSECSKEME